MHRSFKFMQEKHISYIRHYMPPSLHEILEHGHEIIRRAIVPIGMLPEESLEANKHSIKQ